PPPRRLQLSSRGAISLITDQGATREHERRIEEFKEWMIHVREPGCFSFVIAAGAPTRYTRCARLPRGCIKRSMPVSLPRDGSSEPSSCSNKPNDVSALLGPLPQGPQLR